MKKYYNTLLYLLVGLSALPLSAAEKTASKSAIANFLQKGGPVLYILIVLSFVMLCLVFYYLMTIRTTMILPSEFVKQIETELNKKDFEVINKIAQKDDSPVAKIIAAGTNIYLKSKNNYTMIRDAVEDEGSRQAGLLWQKIHPLQDIAVVAPMIGLLGTVIGMINSFMSLTAEVGTPRPTVIASGVSMALITTAAGLIIGITAMILYSYFRIKIQNIIVSLENASSKIVIDMMINEPSSEEVPF
jgi:biopolymer transport protein ExbB